jgi:hypothetical protein
VTGTHIITHNTNNISDQPIKENKNRNTQNTAQISSGTRNQKAKAG